MSNGVATLQPVATLRAVAPGSSMRSRRQLRTAAALSFAASSFVIATFAFAQSSAAILAAYVCFGIAGLALAMWLGRTAGQIYTVVFGVAVVAAVLLYVVFVGTYGAPYWGGGSDELQYEAAAARFADAYSWFEYGAIREDLGYRFHNSVGYIYLVGVLTKFGRIWGGEHTMVPRLFNSACLGIVAALSYVLATRLGLRYRTSLAAGFAVGGLPLMMWVSVQTLRDVVVTLLMVTLVYVWTPDTTRRERTAVPAAALILSLIVLVPLDEMRRAHAVVGVILVLFAILNQRANWRAQRLLFFALPIVAGVGYLVAQFALIVSENFSALIEGAVWYSTLRTEHTGGGLSRTVFLTPLFPVGWIYRVAYALISPLPVEFWPADLAWLSLGTILHLLFIPFLFVGLRLALRSEPWRLVAAAFVSLFIGMAMFTFTMRHIATYLPFAVLLTSLGYERYRRTGPVVLSSMALGGGLLGLVYLALKAL